LLGIMGCGSLSYASENDDGFRAACRARVAKRCRRALESRKRSECNST
jgi:hypothetical protein